MGDRINFELKTEQARDRLLESRRKFGPGDPGHITHGSVQAWLGNRPVVHDIRKLLQAQEVELPTTFQLLASHEIWVVYYAFGIAQESNFKEVVRARLEVQYGEHPHVTIFQVFPTTEFTKWGEGGAAFETDFQLSEEVAMDPSAPAQEVATLPGLLPNVRAAVKVGGMVALSINLSVATLHITAAGVNNDYGLWEFRKHDEFLAGDHLVGHVLLVRGPVTAPVSARLRLSVDVGTFSFWTSSRYTQWVPVSIEPPA